jgi:NAD+ kinase
MPDQWQDPLSEILSGLYWVEERLMVRARVERVCAKGATPQVLCEYDALNDVVLGRGDLARVVRISTKLDGGYLTTYTCDGLIISTATGSTGYALAVHGPILPPEARNILVIPIAPHLSMDRAIVLSEGATVDVVPALERRGSVVVSLDGTVLWHMEAEDRLSVRASQHVSRFLRMRRPNYFYRSLLDRLEPRIKKPTARPPSCSNELGG